MSFFSRLLGYLSVVVNLLLSLALLGLGLIAWLDGSAMTLEPIPDWAGTVTATAIWGGLTGFVAVLLTFRKGKVFRLPMLFWSLTVAWLLGSLFWSASYRFHGMEDFERHAWIFAGYLLVVVGSWLHIVHAAPKGRTYLT